MKLSEFVAQLNKLEKLDIIDINGNPIPAHFHITEAGLVTKHFIDCGGTTRLEKAITFQAWVAEDIDHRLEPQKLIRIIAMAESLYKGEDLDIEVEYQTDTIGKYGLEIQGDSFVLTPKQTACLALDACGTEEEKMPAFDLSGMSTNEGSCTPGGWCC